MPRNSLICKLWNVDANPGITGPPSAKSSTMPTLPRNTSKRDRPLLDRRTVQVEGSAYPVGANVPSIDTNKTSRLDTSGMKYVTKTRTSENNNTRNTTNHNTTKTSPVEGYSLILSLTMRIRIVGAKKKSVGRSVGAKKKSPT